MIGGLEFTFLQKLGSVGWFVITGQETHGKALDIWALGCTFYKMIYGKHPYEGTFLGCNGLKDIQNRIVNDQYTYLYSELNILRIKTSQSLLAAKTCYRKC